MPGAISNQPSGISAFNQVASQTQVERVQTNSQPEKNTSTTSSTQDTVSISAEAKQKLANESSDPSSKPVETAQLHSGTDNGVSPR